MSGSSPTPLGPGSRGPAVRDLQGLLTRLGARIGDPPGTFGADTEAALRAFQHQRPWGAQDALVTRTVREALERLLREREGEREWEEWAARGATLDATALQGRPALVAALQRALAALGLHPDGPAIDGVAGPTLATALRRFRRLARLPGPAPAGLDGPTAAALRCCRWLPAHTAAWTPAAARRRLAAEARRLGASDAHLPLLDRGADHSPWREGLAAIPLPPPSARPVARGDGPFVPYPVLGEAPPIDPSALPFLGPEIGQACVCLGRRGAVGLETAWLAPVHGAELRALEPLLEPWDPAGWRIEPITPNAPAAPPSAASSRPPAVDRQQLSLELP